MKKQVRNKDDKEQILRFVRNAQIKSYFTTTLDSKLEVIRRVVNESNTFFEINEKLKAEKAYPLKIIDSDIESFDNLTYGSPAAFSVLQILYPDLDYSYTSFHIDHIYPKSKFNKKNTLLDQNYIGRQNDLFNLQMLPGLLNQIKSSKDPEKWLEEEYGDVEKIKAYKSRNFIKEDLVLAWDKLTEFEECRSNLIIEELKKKLL